MEFDLDDVLLCSEGFSTSHLEYGGSSSSTFMWCCTHDDINAAVAGGISSQAAAMNTTSCGLNYTTSSTFIETTGHPPVAIERRFESYAVHDEDVVVMEVDDDAITFAVLLEQELLSNSLPHTAAYLPKLRRNHQLRARRLIAVRWILEACKMFHFCPLTAALAVNYLDRYLALNIDPSTSTWMPWMLELLSVACLSIAAKMEEVDVPPLNDLQQARGLEHSFQGATIQRMEMAVMEALKWKLRAVTAVTFAEMAVKALSDVVVVDDERREILMTRPTSQQMQVYSRPAGVLYMQLMDRSTELILGSLSEVEFLSFPASAVALAAVKCALEENFPMKAEAGLADCLLKFIPIDPDDAANCRRTMEELVVDPEVALHVLPGDDCSFELSKSGHHKVSQQIIETPEGRSCSNTSSSSFSIDTGVGSFCTSPTGVLQLHSITTVSNSHTTTDYHKNNNNADAANASIFAANSLTTVPAAASAAISFRRRAITHSISNSTPSNSVDDHDDAGPAAAADSDDVLQTQQRHSNTIDVAAGFFTFPVPRITIAPAISRLPAPYVVVDDHAQQRSKLTRISTAAAADHHHPSVAIIDLDEDGPAAKRQCRSIDRYEE